MADAAAAAILAAEPTAKFNAEKGTDDNDGYYIIKSIEPGKTVSLLPENVHNSASGGSYDTIVSVEKSDSGDVELVYKNAAGDQKKVYESVDSDKKTKAYLVSKEVTAPDKTEKAADGKTVILNRGKTSTQNYVFNAEGESLMNYDDSEKAADGKQVVHFKNSKYYKDTTFVVADDDFDEKTGSCGKRNCFAAVNSKGEETGAILDVDYGQSTIDSTLLARISTHEDESTKAITTEEYYIVEQKGKGLFKTTKSRRYESKTTDDGKKIDEEVLYETTKNSRQKVFQYETASGSDDKYRAYYERVVEGTFYQAKSGVSVDGSCVRTAACETFKFSENDDGITIMTDFEDVNGDGEIDPGEKVIASGEFTERGFLGTTKIADIVDCKKGECTHVIDAAKSRRRRQVLLGATQFQEASGKVLGAFTDTSLQPLSSLMCNGGVCASGLVADLDQWFAGSVLNTEHYESYVCKQHYQNLQAEGVRFTDNGQNVRGIGTANADYSGPQPVLCDLDQVENEGCPDNHYCEQDLCYSKDTNEVAMGYLYYITWGVTAPQDEASTVYIDETGSGVTFNIVLKRSSGSTFSNGEFSIGTTDKKEVRLYDYQGDNNYPLKLYTGDSDGAKVVHMSVDDQPFSQICIEWGIAPTTVSNPATSGFFDNSKKSRVVPNLCTDIEGEQIDAVQLLGGLIDTKAQAANSQSSVEESSVTTSELETNNDW